MFLTLVCACSQSQQKSLVIEKASQEVSHGNFSEAVAMIDNMFAAADTAGLTAGDYCRVAMIYAVAADNDVNRDVNIAEAAKWLSHAKKLSSDSVSVFIHSLPPERQAVIYSVDLLNQNKGYDYSTFEGEAPQDNCSADSSSVHTEDISN